MDPFLINSAKGQMLGYLHSGLFFSYQAHVCFRGFINKYCVLILPDCIPFVHGNYSKYILLGEKVLVPT